MTTKFWDHYHSLGILTLIALNMNLKTICRPSPPTPSSKNHIECGPLCQDCFTCMFSESINAAANVVPLMTRLSSSFSSGLLCSRLICGPLSALVLEADTSLRSLGYCG